MTQVPARTLAWCKGESGRVVDLPGHEDKSRLLGNREHVAPAQLDIRWCVGPAVDIGGYVNHHAAGWRMVLQILQRLLLLSLDQLQRSSTVTTGQIWRKAGGRRVGLDLADELIPALLLELTHLYPDQHSAHGIRRGKKTSSPAQNRAEAFAIMKAVVPR